MNDEERRPRLSRNAGRTIIQLLVASIFVGAVFSFLGLDAIDFWRGLFESLRNLIRSLGESLGEVVVTLATYLIIGAAIVVPIWLIAKLIRGR